MAMQKKCQELLVKLGQSEFMEKVTLFVDAQEPLYLRDLFKTSSLNVQQLRLPVGDYWLLYDGYLIFVWERKTMADLNGSIFGRHDSQYSRLCELPLPRDHLGYLVIRQDEREIENFKGMDMIINVIEDMKCTQGIATHWFADETEMVFSILTRAKYLGKRGDTILTEIDLTELKIPSNPEEESLLTQSFDTELKENDVVASKSKYKRVYGPLSKWVGFARLTKKGNDTPEHLYLLQLRGIRGMGKKAEVIAARYPSWSSLETLRREHGEEKAVHILENLPTTGTARLGPALAQKVIYCLITSNPPAKKKGVGTKRKTSPVQVKGKTRKRTTKNATKRAL